MLHSQKGWDAHGNCIDGSFKEILFGTNGGIFMRTENFVLAIFAIIFWDFLILY